VKSGGGSCREEEVNRRWIDLEEVVKEVVEEERRDSKEGW